jgi:mannose-1-phosphate guanylyltransferase
MSDRFVLVLAGGRGERFWPWSRPQRPKQLLPLASGGRTLLRATFERALKTVQDPQRVLIVTATDLITACRKECPGARVVGEPMPRNTAPAIAAAAGHFLRDSSSFAVMPADHAIEDSDAFAADLDLGFQVAERESVLVTFGVKPTGPETNFGYVRRGAKLRDRVHRVARFTEKPDRTHAEQYAASGEYSWNTGIFVWRKSVFFDALEASKPEMAATFRNFGAAGTAGAFEARLAEVFPRVESISVDYAVLEQAPNVVMIEARFDWDDLGSWSAWARRQPRDERGNVRFGDTEVVDCDRCVVVGDGGTAAALGLTDMVVVHADGGTLACRLDQTERVRRVSDALRQRGSG